MKTKNILLCAVVLLFASCKSDEEIKPLTASINVINANVDISNLKVNPTGKAISWNNTTEQIAYGTNKFNFVPVGVINVIAVSSVDTSKVLFNSVFNFKSTIYTMYISGTASQVDTMFREEVNLPFIRTDQIKAPSADSVVNIRVVNLSSGSPALRVRLSTATTNDFDNLSYRTISPWKPYPAKLATTTYSFQIRNAGTDALITTHNFVANVNNRFKNVALVIRGVFGTTTGTAPFGVSAVNYY